jgi:amino acid transporter
MGEIHRKWFTTTWGVLLLFSVVMAQLMRHTDIAWVHNPGVVLLYEVVSWVTLVVTILLFVWYNVIYWRESRRLFWRKWRRWGGNLAIGVAMLVVLLIAINIFKGDKVELSGDGRHFLFALFAAGGLIWGLARYKFKKN